MLCANHATVLNIADGRSSYSFSGRELGPNRTELLSGQTISIESIAHVHTPE